MVFALCCGLPEAQTPTVDSGGGGIFLVRIVTLTELGEIEPAETLPAEGASGSVQSHREIFIRNFDNPDSAGSGSSACL